MDKEIIFFIIFVVFSILSSLLNKKKKNTAAPQSGEDSPYQPQRKKKPFSIEDILREFEAETMGKPEPVKEYERPEPEEESYTYGELGEKTYEEMVKENDEKRKSPYQSYEGTSYEKMEEDLEEMTEKVRKFKRDEHFELENSDAEDFAQILKSHEGLKRAVVLKEILDRKHF